MLLRPRPATRRALLCAALAAALTPLAWSQTLTEWNGEGGSGSWFNDLNWVGGARPPSNSLSDVRVATATSGTVVTTMTLSSTRTIRTLTFDNTAGQFPNTLNFDTNPTPAVGTTPTDRTLTVHGGFTVANTTTTVSFRGNNGVLTLNLAANNTYNVGAGGQLQILNNVLMVGASSVEKTGTGALLMGTGKTFSGGFILTEGRLRTNGSSTTASGAIVGSPFGLGTLTLRGGILQAFGTTGRFYHNSVVIDGDVTLGGLALDGVTVTGLQTFSAIGGGSTSVSSGIHTLDTQSPVTWNQAISGEGDIVKTGPADLTLGGVNSFAGDLEIAAGGLVLADTAEYRFTLGDGGLTNTITGAGSATYDGLFRIDPSAVTADGSWTLVNVASETYGTAFNLALADDTPFTAAGEGLYTAGVWTYDTATGVLTRDSSTPPPLSALDTWRQQNLGSSTNTGTSADTSDPDGDGIPNLLEYALGLNPQVANPGALPSAGLTGPVLQLSFQRIADPALTYVVEASSTLEPASWATIWSSTGSANVAGPVTVDDTAPLTGNPRRFLRLRVSY